jgi:polar amino acid transport system substrate-binding protein
MKCVQRLVASTFVLLGIAVGLMVVDGNCAVAQGTSGKTLIAEIQERGTLRVGVDQGRPLVFKDARSGQWQGIFLDALQLWADTMKVKLEPVPTTWGNMVAGLQAGQFDVAAALNPTPVRSLAVVFSNPLIYEIDALAVRRDSGLDAWEAINSNSRTICVMLGAAPDLALTAAKPQAKILRLKDENECNLALTNGRADAFYNAAVDLAAFAATNNKIGLVFPPAPFLRQGIAFAFRPSIDLQSLESFNIALGAFVMSGAFGESKEKWGFVGPQKYTLGTIPSYVTEAGY